MGESKAKRKGAARVQAPAKLFEDLGIDCSNPGFYDDPSFQAEERRDPKFLEEYARFVRDRSYSLEYTERARRLVPEIASMLAVEMERAGRERACMDGGLALSKMLEQVGIWNFVVRGAFSVQLDGQPNTRRFFHAFGPLDAGASVHGHVWVHCPPFVVVDVAARLQPWGIPAYRTKIPSVVLSEQTGGVVPDIELLLDHDQYLTARRMGVNLTLENSIAPEVHTFMREFRGTKLERNGVHLVFQPTAVTAPDCPFDEIGTGPGGLNASRIWNDVMVSTLEGKL